MRYPISLARFFCGILFVCLATAAHADIRNQVETLLTTTLAETSAPSLSVAVAHQGKLLLAVAVGQANKANNIAATPATQYRTGSIAKVIGTTALMTLVEQAKVKLTDPITAYLPYLPDHYALIHLDHLMAHTSGVRHYQWGEYGTNTSYPTLETATRVFRDSPLEFPPGSDYQYSTYGINLLQGVIEKTTEQSLSSFMTSALFTPLKMTGTQLEIKGQDSPDYATGYRKLFSNTPVKAIDVSNKYIGGGMRSTPSDLVNMVSAIEKGQILSTQTKRLMLSAPFPEVAPDRAHGWRLMTYKNQATYGHGGAINGFESLLVHFIDDEITVALMVNQDDYDHTNATLYKVFDLVKQSIVVERTTKQNIQAH